MSETITPTSLNESPRIIVSVLDPDSVIVGGVVSTMSTTLINLSALFPDESVRSKYTVPSPNKLVFTNSDLVILNDVS